MALNLQYIVKKKDMIKRNGFINGYKQLTKEQAPLFINDFLKEFEYGSIYTFYYRLRSVKRFKEDYKNRVEKLFEKYNITSNIWN